MKKIAANVTSLIVVVLLFTAAGYSQFMQQPVLKADIPFEFNIGKKTFPAGEYRVVKIAPHTLALRNGNDRFLASIVTAPVLSLNARSTPKLKFEFADGQYVLSEVWPSGSSTGYQLSMPKRFTSFAQNRTVEARASVLSSK